MLPTRSWTWKSDVMISHGWPAKLLRRCSFFLSVLSFLFSFSFFFFTMLLALSVFLLTKTNMLSWKGYNLNLFAEPTRCHPFKSLLQQPDAITCMVVIHFATRGSTPLKKWSWWRNLVANLLLKLLHALLRKVGKKDSSVEGNEEYMEFFVIESIAAPSAFSFLPGAVNLAKPS